jgi:hypothetical protein
VLSLRTQFLKHSRPSATTLNETRLQAARNSADALARKLKALQSTVFEQAQQLKEASIDKLKEEMVESWNAAQCEGQDDTVTAAFLETSEKIRDYRIHLKDDILKAQYSSTEIDEAKERLQRVKQIESCGSNDSHDGTDLVTIGPSSFIAEKFQKFWPSPHHV